MQTLSAALIRFLTHPARQRHVSAEGSVGNHLVRPLKSGAELAGQYLSQEFGFMGSVASRPVVSLVGEGFGLTRLPESSDLPTCNNRKSMGCLRARSPTYVSAVSLFG